MGEGVEKRGTIQGLQWLHMLDFYPGQCEDISPKTQWQCNKGEKKNLKKVKC
jgi:hypothetical protein